MNWAALAAWAGAVPTGGDSLGLRYEPGDATLAGGRTMGLLVVEGDLTLSSGARHTGLVLVRGTLRLDGAGGTVIGAVVASQIVAVNGYTVSQPAVSYSACAVDLAGRSRALPVSLQGLRATAFF
jgi:formylmethanofuran dehydrogenase subunit C